MGLGVVLRGDPTATYYDDWCPLLTLLCLVSYLLWVAGVYYSFADFFLFRAKVPLLASGGVVGVVAW